MEQVNLFKEAIKIYESLDPFASIESAINKVIDNGFIISKWVYLKDQSPDRGVAKLVCLKSGFITVGYLKSDKKFKEWQLFGDITTFIYSGDEVIKWMDLPTS